MKAALLDAVRFCETGRLAYNGVLAAALFVFAFATDSWLAIGRNFGAVIALGVIANLLYCAAYPLDFLVQATPLGVRWRQWRPIAWAAGTLLSLLLAIVALFGVSGPF